MFAKRAAAAASFPLVALSVGARAMKMAVWREVAWHHNLVIRNTTHTRRAETERARAVRGEERGVFAKRAAAAASFPLVALSVGVRAMKMVVCREVAWHVRRPLVCRVGRHARRRRRSARGR